MYSWPYRCACSILGEKHDSLSFSHIVTTYAHAMLTGSISIRAISSLAFLIMSLRTFPMNIPFHGCSFSQNVPTGTISVRASSSVAFPSARFAVKDYGCSGGATEAATPKNCTTAVLAAIAAARAAGGGEVFFDVGRWWVF